VVCVIYMRLVVDLGASIHAEQAASAQEHGGECGGMWFLLVKRSMPKGRRRLREFAYETPAP
jgi:hypothetical protein